MSNENTQRVADAYAEVCDYIKSHELETFKHYPKDMELDHATLMEYGAQGSKWAWKIGHCGTHLFQLGLHPKRNEHVTYVTNQSSSDIFFYLEFTYSGYKLKKLDAKEFELLQNTPVPYSQEGSDSGFWLLHGTEKLCSCEHQFVGTHQNPKYKTTLRPVRKLTLTEIRAVEEFAQWSLVRLAHTLFVRTETVWASLHRDAA